MQTPFDPERICNSKSRRPGRYTKEELLNLGEGFGFRFKKTHTIDHMCDALRRHHEERNRQETRGCFSRCATNVKPYQRKAVEFLNTHPALFLYHKMGAGKTLTAIVASQCFLDQNPTRNVVVICPSSLIDSFKQEMNERYGNVQHRNRYKFYSIENVRINQNRLLRDLEDGMLIVDEAHRLLNDTKMSRILTSLPQHHCRKVLLMSGTPIIYSKNFDSDVYGKLMYIDPPEMQNLLCKISFYERAPRDPNYPRRRNYLVRIPMTPEYERRYNSFLRRIHYPNMDHVPSAQQMADQQILPIIFDRVENPDSLKNLRPFLTGIRRATQNLDNSENNEKINWIVTFLRTHRGEKTIIFSSYLKDGIDLIKGRMGNRFSYGEITGKKTIKARHETVKKYNENRLKVLFLSASAAREGISLKNTKNVIIFEPQWNDPMTEQMIARAIRYKSHESLPVEQRVVHVYSLYHLRADEYPSISKHELSNIFQNLPVEICEEIIQPFLPVDNQNVKDFEAFVKDLTTRKNTILREWQTTTNEIKQVFQQQLRRPNTPDGLSLRDLSIDYYFYFHNLLKTIQLHYYEHKLQQLSIEKNECG